MECDLSAQFASAEKGLVIAPAGCGKTELIASAVSRNDGLRSLILTHTNAGVLSLQKRLARFGVGAQKFHLDTISGWVLRYCQAYPTASGVTIDPAGDNIPWADLYDGMARLLKLTAITQVIKRSYSGIFVDEYQDCTLSQHKVVRELTSILPCRIVGDPLQAIFDFLPDGLVSWETDIPACFIELGRLNTPWRWSDGNEELGRWLLHVRTEMENTRALSLEDLPSAVVWMKSTMENQKTAGFQALNHNSESAVLIHKFPADAHRYASMFRGRLTSGEELEGRDLCRACKNMDSLSGLRRAAELLEFCAACQTKIGTIFKAAISKYKSNKVARITARTKHVEVLKILNSLNDSLWASELLRVMELLENIEEAFIYRHELWRDMKAVLIASEPVSLLARARAIRMSRSKQMRRIPRRMVSRTLLIKGLEFDHCVILDADRLTTKELYVALTRPRKSLTVLSKQKLLKPKQNSPRKRGAACVP